MRKIVTVSASLAALALLAACGSRQPAPPPVVVVPPSPPAPVVTNQTPAPTQSVAGVPKANPGYGRVETVTALPTASAGGTAPAMMNRIAIKMADGSTQYVDTSVAGLAPGDRIEITTEGYLKR